MKNKESAESALGKFEKISRKNLSDQIVRQIKAMIESGLISPGERLPSERELSQLLNVSRLPLREALKSLQQINVLEVRQTGYFVRGLESSNLLDFFNNALSNHNLLAELLEARIVLELGAVELACMHRTEEDIRKMQESLNRMDLMIQTGSRDVIEYSMEFHNDIAAASGNNLFIAIMACMSSVLYEGRKKSLEIDNRYTLAVEEHKNILQAIINRDAEAAKRLMRIHLDTAYMISADS